MFFKFLFTLRTWGLLSVSARQARLNLKPSMKFMLKWPAGSSEHQQNAGFGPHICFFKSLILSSLQSSLKSAAEREGALCLRLSGVAGFGKV